MGIKAGSKFSKNIKSRKSLYRLVKFLWKLLLPYGSPMICSDILIFWLADKSSSDFEHLLFWYFELKTHILGVSSLERTKYLIYISVMLLLCMKYLKETLQLGDFWNVPFE